MIGFFATMGSLIISALVILVIGTTYYLVIEEETTRGRAITMLVIEWLLVAGMLYLTLAGVE